MSCRSEKDSRLSLVDPTPTSDPEISSVVSFFYFVAAVCGSSPCCIFIFALRSSCNMGLCNMGLKIGRDFNSDVRVGLFDRSVGSFYPASRLVC